MKFIQFTLTILISFFWIEIVSAEVSSAKEPALLDLAAEAKKSSLEQSNKINKPASEPVSVTAKQPVQAKPKPKVKIKDKPIKWGYSGNIAPEYWGSLSEKYSMCKTGKNQSPVNILNKKSVGTTSLPGFDVRYRDVPLKIINNGNSIQVNYPLGSYIELNNKRFHLLHFNFRTPSEHQLDGFNYPMEMQVTHKDSKGNLVIIAIVFIEGKGNLALHDILRKLPKDVGKEHLHEKIIINPSRFFPAEKKFYKYTGSLTTPPCSEGVYWVVFKRTMEASASQIARMHSLLGDNNRPVQKIHGRTILKSWPDRSTIEERYEFN